MFFWLVVALCILVLLFGFVVFVGPPYLPTTRKQIDVVFDLLDMKPGDTLLDLGSGDGRILVAAAQRGYKAVGVELNPVLVGVSWLATRRYRKQVRLVWGSFWGTPWPRADVVFTFMLPCYMKRLDQRIEAWRSKPLRLASFAFAVPDREPARSRAGVYLYEYK